MLYDLINELVTLVKTYEEESVHTTHDLNTFRHWLDQHSNLNNDLPEPEWEGKAKGRSADSVINTSLVHLYRYAKIHAKTAIANTPFSTPDEFIYLISLVSFGSMSKTSLIRLNIHEKSAGIQIINRLIKNEWAEQHALDSDKRNKMIHITPKGEKLLNESMENIRKASARVTGPLSHNEKMNLINILLKLEKVHQTESNGMF
ncbi:DNA-binding MarR family transcriptional regulator [Pedobacter cryoconitis]|uniref:DNA-binding MarR family transcriptional regulator n=1 Tax=Pedobacter cryoconitis TaxID=188932 RepID=A0A7W8ZJC0_9SPHI|nr:winged helix DNA-binding protein [Pedobacter cryoconitis]MBB5635013.1 DNA-binding MarR family transcriptional regulator [Pedobacter cryoconitis]MBB6271803.1 DNA-binding MarR family transcriptional regulator [Pedobacter cryoconitis]